MASLELRIPPVIVWLACAGVMSVLVYSLPNLSFTRAGTSALALVLLAIGVTVTIAGVTAFRSKRTTVNPLTPGASSAIVASGVYRLSRNPMYLGMLLALAGWAVFLSNLGAALILPVFVAYITQYQIKPEERALLGKFGGEYAQYTAKVRRWL